MKTLSSRITGRSQEGRQAMKPETSTARARGHAPLGSRREMYVVETQHSGHELEPEWWPQRSFRTLEAADTYSRTILCGPIPSRVVRYTPA